MKKVLELITEEFAKAYGKDVFIKILILNMSGRVEKAPFRSARRRENGSSEEKNFQDEDPQPQSCEPL